MIHIYSRILPPDGYWAMSIAPFLIQRKGTNPLQAKDLNHECIHCAQQTETTLVGFFVALIGAIVAPSWWWIILPFTLYYILYGVFYIVYFIKGVIDLVRKDRKLNDAIRITIKMNTGYYMNPYEQEAYDMEGDLQYLIYRTPFYSWRYLMK